MGGDRLVHLRKFDSHALGFNHQFLDLVAQQLGALLAGGVGQHGDDGADAGTSFEQPFTDQMGNDLVGYNT